MRLIHPRFPLYVIPRENHRFMLGATSIESESSGVSVHSALELLGAAYAVHPAFGEARILEFGSGLRPAYPDNLTGALVIDNDRDGGELALSPRPSAGASASPNSRACQRCRARHHRRHRGDAMRVTINGDTGEISSMSVAEYAARARLRRARYFTVAVNYDVLPKSRWAETQLKAGDEIEIITPRQGG